MAEWLETRKIKCGFCYVGLLDLFELKCTSSACVPAGLLCFGWSVLAAKKSESLTGLVVSVDIKHHVYILT